jgi:hypothetical protein
MPDGMMGMMGHNGGPPMGRPPMFTYDGLFTKDSTGAFLIGELERLDQTLHGPLFTVTWGRDIDLREDVTVGDEYSSYTNSSFAAAGGINPAGIAWIAKDTNAITGAQLDIGKTPQPLFLWAMELNYTMPELASAMQLGRPVDDQKFQVIRTKHQMDIDQLVYIGDSTVGSAGLVNHPLVSNSTNVTGGTWQAAITAATPAILLQQINELLTSVWQASAFAVMPDRILVPPAQFSMLVSNIVSSAGNISILRFLQENNLAATAGKTLEIQPAKWLIGRGTAGAQRMVAYTKNYDYIRYPMTPLQRTPLEWRSLYNITTYWGRLGMIEVVYPELVGYRDGI